MFTTNSRKGVTPIIAIILLLMMTVAAAGAAYTWFSQMQQDLQDQARADLQTTLVVRDVRCNAKPDNTVEIAISNSGSTTVDASEVDVFIRGSAGHLNSTVADRDWSDQGFEQPGGFGEVTVDLANTDTGSTFMVPGNFYKVEAEFVHAGYTLSAGGCLGRD